MKFTSEKDQCKSIDIEPGIYYDVPWNEYAKWNAFSKSMVSSALKSPAHLHEYLNTHRKTAAMALGSLVDCLLLEHDTFDDSFVVRPDTYEDAKGVTKPFNMRSNWCKSWVAENDASGKTVISSFDIKKAQSMADAVRCHKGAASMLDGKTQISIAWRHEETGIMCKGRLDAATDEAIYDLKTCQDASQEAFSRAAANFGYDVQGGIYQAAYAYLTGVSQYDLPFRFVCVENVDFEAIAPPVAVYEMGNASLECGRWIFDRACHMAKKYADANEVKNVKSYSDFVEPLSVPEWRINSEMYHPHNEGKVFEI